MSVIKLRDLSCKYGAPMGRGNESVKGKCKLQLVPLDGGAYWGIGAPYLYVCEDENGHQFFVRGDTRTQAKKEVLEHNPLVTFYR